MTKVFAVDSFFFCLTNQNGAHFVIIVRRKCVCVCWNRRPMPSYVNSERSITRFVCLAQRPFVHASNELQSICMDQFKPYFESNTNRKVRCNCRIRSFFTFELQRNRAAHIYSTGSQISWSFHCFSSSLFLFRVCVCARLCLVSIILTLFYLFNS